MGFLLVHHELLRAKAKVNSLTYDQTRFKHKQDRIKKAIQKKEEFYNKKNTTLENYFRDAKTSLTNAINNGSFAAAGAWLQIPSGISDGVESIFQGMAGSTMTNINVPGVKLNPDSTGTDDKYISETDPTKKFSETQFVNLQLQQFQLQNQQMAQLKATYQTIMEQFLESMKEVAKNALEDEKDAALLPLNEEDTDMEIKITTNEVQLESAKEYAKNLEAEMKDRVKDSTPKFGLG